MLYTIKNLTAVYPKLFRTKTAESKLPVQSVRMDELKVQSVHSQLSRVWIETGDPRTPLKSVLIDEAEMHDMANEAGEALLAEIEMLMAEAYASE